MKRMLEAKLAKMSRDERSRLYKRAVKLRKAAAREDRYGNTRGRQRARNATWRNWEEEVSPHFEKSKKREGSPLDAFVLRLLLDEEGTTSDTAGQEGPAARTATVKGTATT